MTGDRLNTANTLSMQMCAMSTMKPSRAGPEDGQAAVALRLLLALPLNERRKAVSKDVRQPAPQFRSIAAHDLADALNVPAHWRPDNEWSFISFAPIVSVEEHAKCNSPASELVYLIEDAVSAERFEELLKQSEQLDDVDDPGFAFLSNGERSRLEEIIAERQLEANESNGMNCIARCSVESESGEVLDFEGDIEDDGACINLRTPYDKLANCFTDLSSVVRVKL